MKNYISLPLFYYNQKFNDYFIDFIKKYPDSKRFEFYIDSFHGSFPFVYWNGELNCNYIENNSSLPLNKDYYLFNFKPYNIRHNFTNNFINSEKEYQDVHGNIILKLEENGSNQVEVNDIKFLEYLYKKYPNFNYIFNLNKFSKDLNLLKNFNYINKFVLENYNEKFIDYIPKSKLEIIINEQCKDCLIEKKIECRNQENINQINFSEKSVYKYCETNDLYKNINYIEDIIKFYNNLGIYNFKINSPVYSKLKEFNIYIIKSLIKKEYYEKFFKNYN